MKWLVTLPAACLNNILIKGPDVLNLIRSVLLRFRAGVFSALGDKDSVWLEKREVHLHRFRDGGHTSRQIAAMPSLVGRFLNQTVACT